MADSSFARHVEHGPAKPPAGVFFDFDRTSISGFSAYFVETERFLRRGHTED